MNIFNYFKTLRLEPDMQFSINNAVAPINCLGELKQLKKGMVELLLLCTIFFPVLIHKEV